MSGAQTRMAVLLDVRLRATRPHVEIAVQLLARLLETRGVQLSNRRGFGRRIDEVVKTVDEAADALAAAHLLEGSSHP